MYRFRLNTQFNLDEVLSLFLFCRISLAERIEGEGKESSFLSDVSIIGFRANSYKE